MTAEIARLGNLPPDVVEGVLQEYQRRHAGQQFVTRGGKSFAVDALRQALGESRAEDMIRRVEAATERSGFGRLHGIGDHRLAQFLEEEHPQTAALVLSHIHPGKAADVLGEVEEDLQAEILYRLSTMGKTSADFVEDVGEVFEQKLDVIIGPDLNRSGGVELTAEILSAIPRSSQREVFSRLSERTPELTDEIASIMFTFDDLVHVGSEDLHTLLMQVDQTNLALALKAASDALKDKVYRSLSDRATERLREAVDLLGRVRVSDVDDAQRQIMQVARELERTDQITLERAEDVDYL